MDQARKARHDILALNHQIQNMGKTIDAYRNGQSSLDEENTYFQEKFLAGEDQIPKILEVLGEVVRKSQVEVISIRPNELQTKTWQNLTFQTMGVSLQVEGRYIALVECLKRFLDIPFLVDITNVKLSKGDRQQVIMNLELETFFIQ